MGTNRAPIVRVGGGGAMTKKTVTWSYAWIDPSYGDSLLLAHTNVSVDRSIMCMCRGKKKKPFEVKCNDSASVPRQHSNDRLTFPAQDMIARNQSHCPECIKYNSKFIWRSRVHYCGNTKYNPKQQKGHFCWKRGLSFNTAARNNHHIVY